MLNEEELEEFYIDYIVDYIMEIQDLFLDFYDKGDPLKGGIQYRFPVVTLSVSKKKWGDKYIIDDEDFVREMCKREIFRYNIFVSEGSKVASCCRLINDDELMQLGSQSNSFGAGGSVSLGSHRVCTINLHRIALENSTFKSYIKTLEERIVSAVKILKAHKKLLKELTDLGLQPFIKDGWIAMPRLFSTIGLMGYYEAGLYSEKYYNKSRDEFLRTILAYINKRAWELSKEYNLIVNIEQIPGESFAIRLANADRLLYGEDKVPYKLYANQFIPLWEKTTIWERLEKDGKYNQLITGGGIVHATIIEDITGLQARRLIDFAIRCGCEHFALNKIISLCEKNHSSTGDFEICPICKSPIIEKYTRVVGFFTPISSFNPIRREWEFPRRDRLERKDFEDAE